MWGQKNGTISKVCVMVAMVTLALSARAHSATTVVTVSGKQGPWDPTVNPMLSYGVGDQQSATSISSGFDFSSGSRFTIKYLSGATSFAVGSQYYDASGDPNDAFGTGYGSSSYPLPGEYTATNPTYLNELIGTFANASGVVIGTPFALGDAPSIEIAPPGATQLLLGINDYYFSDNSGALEIQVIGPSLVSSAPEPSTWTLLIAGVAVAGAALRSRRRGWAAA